MIKWRNRVLLVSESIRVSFGNISILYYLIFIITQHVMGHHPFTNIDGHDPDIMTSAPDTYA